LPLAGVKDVLRRLKRACDSEDFRWQLAEAFQRLQGGDCSEEDLLSGAEPAFAESCCRLATECAVDGEPVGLLPALEGLAEHGNDQTVKVLIRGIEDLLKLHRGSWFALAASAASRPAPGQGDCGRGCAVS